MGNGLVHEAEVVKAERDGQQEGLPQGELQVELQAQVEEGGNLKQGTPRTPAKKRELEQGPQCCRRRGGSHQT